MKDKNKINGKTDTPLNVPRYCEKGEHDWMKLTSIQKGGVFLFASAYQKDEKIVCLKCCKEIRA